VAPPSESVDSDDLHGFFPLSVERWCLGGAGTLTG
jgi:hypothetical protein